MAWDSDDPASMSSRTVFSFWPRYLFSTWVERTANERLIDSPESTMVANCRVNTATSLGLMRSLKPGMTISPRSLPPWAVTDTGR